jgi:hypothetical protein
MFLSTVSQLKLLLSLTDLVGFSFLVSLGGVRLSPLGTSAAVGLLYQPRMIDDDDDYGTVGGMRIGRGNRSTRRKPAPVPLCPPQILHDLTWDRTRAAAVGSQRLTAWAMARPWLRWLKYIDENLKSPPKQFCKSVASFKKIHFTSIQHINNKEMNWIITCGCCPYECNY